MIVIWHNIVYNTFYNHLPKIYIHVHKSNIWLMYCWSLSHSLVLTFTHTFIYIQYWDEEYKTCYLWCGNLKHFNEMRSTRHVIYDVETCNILLRFPLRNNRCKLWSWNFQMIHYWFYFPTVSKRNLTNCCPNCFLLQKPYLTLNYMVLWCFLIW